jgi:hypothetical protein
MYACMHATECALCAVAYVIFMVYAAAQSILILYYAMHARTTKPTVNLSKVKDSAQACGQFLRVATL